MASLQHHHPIMQLSEIGKIAEYEWIKSVEIRPDMNLELGEFVVMPNHFHAVIIIGKNQFNTIGEDRGEWEIEQDYGLNKPSNAFGPQSKNLASIIRGYKSAVTTYARKNNIPFEWQPLYHDRIIRSKEEYYRISRYIKRNPEKWRDDKLNKRI